MDTIEQKKERLSSPRLAADLLDLCGCERPTKNDNSLRGRYIAPPFSVLDAKAGEWQDRKREWLAIGIKSEVGRAKNLLDVSASMAGITDEKEREEWNANRRVRCGLTENNSNETQTSAGTSIFDPVLTEICFSWFCPSSGIILDPFAGGSVRGIVAGKMGLQYQGHELRDEQVAANREQAAKICPDACVQWITGDSAQTITQSDVMADMVFSCPPYGSLEKYSDDPADISNMPFEQFAETYTRIIGASCAKLRDNRFAAFVVGNYRDTKTGHYRDLVGITIRAFESAGLGFYNDIVLLNAVGSAAVRAGKQFQAGRKVVKVHQNVLVFVKGDWRKATKVLASPD